MYDPAIGRFFTQDRFAEKYFDYSPYQYAANNPILNIDINGDSIKNVCMSPKDPSVYQGAGTKMLSDIAIGTLELTDLNDATVLATMVTRKGDAVNFGGETASTVDKVSAGLAVVAPLVGGKIISDIIDKGAELLGFSKKAKINLGPNDAPQRVQGPWTTRDLERASNGQGPVDMMPRTNAAGREMPLELHHGDQMPGSAIHEVGPGHPKSVNHPNKYNQGVTPQMRKEDSQLHWQLRGQEMGNKPL